MAFHLNTFIEFNQFYVSISHSVSDIYLLYKLFFL